MSHVDQFVNFSQRLGNMKKQIAEKTGDDRAQWELKFQELVSVLFKIEHEYGLQRDWDKELLAELESGLTDFEDRKKLATQFKVPTKKTPLIQIRNIFRKTKLSANFIAKR